LGEDEEEIKSALAVCQGATDALLVLAIGCSCTTARSSWTSLPRHRLPGVHAYRELVEAGGLMSFGPSYADMHKRAVYFVDRILKGAKPG